MKNVWFISDTHFHHENFLNFTDDEGKKIRPFSSVEEMNEFMIEKWNDVVRDGDRVYHLGDVSFAYGSDLESVMTRLRGSKRLTLGNHDDLKKTNLASFFKKVTLWRLFKDEKFVISHVPMHPGSFRKAVVNVHGHTHEKIVEVSPGVSDLRYVNVCVEQVGYRPVHFDELLEIISRRMELIDGS